MESNDKPIERLLSSVPVGLLVKDTMLSEKLTSELGVILEEDYNLVMSPEELTLFANDFAEFFHLLIGGSDE